MNIRTLIFRNINMFDYGVLPLTPLEIGYECISPHPHGSTALVSLDLLTAEISRPHSDYPHSVGRVFSLSQRPLTGNTQHSKETDVHTRSGIRTCNSNKRAAADLRCYRNRLCYCKKQCKLNDYSQLNN